MRRAPTVILLTVAAWFVVPAALVSAQTPRQDSVAGTATASFDYEIDVRSGPSGENPTGQLLADSFPSGLFFGGPPTCLAVRDNVATMNISDDLGPFGFGIVTVQVIDANPDIVAVTLGRAPGDCSPLTSPIASAPVTSGDLVVTDVSPLPTATAQCKDGGWRNFGVFKNQGDCVSFVATGGRNQPGGA
jgi:hypothetical protein